MHTLIALYLFILGAAFGSFALVLVDRMSAKKDWIRGRSKCDHCHKTLKPAELVPIVSWLFQRGKCKNCKTKVPISYPATEILCGAFFLSSFLWFPYRLDNFTHLSLFILWLLICVLMTALIVFDLRSYILPTNIVYTAVCFAVLHKAIAIHISDQSVVGQFLLLGLSVAVSSGFFWVLHSVSSGKWIGFGDVRFGLVIGLLVPNPVQSWMSIFFASIFGLVFGVAYAIFSGGTKYKSIPKMKIPFGPYLILGLFVVYLFGQRITDWYLTSFI